MYLLTNFNQTTNLTKDIKVAASLVQDIVGELGILRNDQFVI
jgi:hypothetical protein